MSPNAHKLDNYNDNNRFCCLMLRYERAHAQAKEFSSGWEEGVLVKVQSFLVIINLVYPGVGLRTSAL